MITLTMIFFIRQILSHHDHTNDNFVKTKLRALRVAISAVEIYRMKESSAKIELIFFIKLRVA